MMKIKRSEIEPSSPIEEEKFLRKFRVTGKDLEGNKVRLTLRANSISNLQSDISAQGILDAKYREILKLSEIQIGSSVSQAELLNFSRQMAAFTQAGIGVLDALTLLKKANKNKHFKKILAQMIQEIIGGATLVAAVRQHEDIFPKYYVSVLESAERTGEISETFELLSRYIERDLASIRSVKSALYYPALLIVVAIATVFVLSVMVLPKFTIFFESLNAKLPLSTRILITFTNFTGNYWQFIVLFCVALAVGFIAYRRTDQGEKFFDAILLNIPGIGAIFKLIILERFSRILSNLLEGGIPLPDCLDLTASAVSNRVYRDAILETKVGVISGDGLSQPMVETGVFPEETTQILSVGEQSGQLSTQLSHAATFYSKEVDFKLKNLSTLIEPVVLLIVGGGVGFVAIALISAMYGIYSSSGLNG